MILAIVPCCGMYFAQCAQLEPTGQAEGAGGQGSVRIREQIAEPWRLPQA